MLLGWATGQLLQRLGRFLGLQSDFLVLFVPFELILNIFLLLASFGLLFSFQLLSNSLSARFLGNLSLALLSEPFFSLLVLLTFLFNQFLFLARRNQLLILALFNRLFFIALLSNSFFSFKSFFLLPIALTLLTVCNSPLCFFYS